MKNGTKMWVVSILAVLGLMLPAAQGGDTFDFVIETTTTPQTFTFQVDGASGFTIDWGDGTAVSNAAAGTSARSRVYANPGTYTIKVKGTATRISFWQSASVGTPALLRNITSKLTDGVTGITSAASMFRNATGITTFTQADWFDAASANVTTMLSMFNGASAFNQDISGWDVSKVTTMQSMFQLAGAFNQPIGGWNVSKVTNMSIMFQSASSFNQPIGGWDVSKVTTMAQMFQSASAFNQPIGGWDVSSVTIMRSMFLSASAFNQPIGGWDVSSVTQTHAMFQSASAFNQDIGGWDVGNVSTMNNMFQNATAFNQDIGGWDVGNVTTMLSMFQHSPSHAFNQDISGWDVRNVTTMADMLNGVTLSTENYNKLLMSWSTLPLKSTVSFHAGSSKYDLGLPKDGRDVMTGTFSWTITDGGTTGNTLFVPSGTVFRFR